MKVTRIYSDENGKSCFGEKQIELESAGDIGSLSAWQKSSKFLFRETPGTYDYMWHNAPRRQLLVNLAGGVEITVSSGESRQFRAGSLILLEDTDGEGHCSKAIDGEPRSSLFIALD